MNNTIKKVILGGLPIILICSLMMILASASDVNALEASSVGEVASQFAEEGAVVEGSSNEELALQGLFEAQAAASEEEPQVDAKGSQVAKYNAGDVGTAVLNLTDPDDDMYGVLFTATHSSMVLTLKAESLGGTWVPLEMFVADVDADLVIADVVTGYEWPELPEPGLYRLRYDNLTPGKQYGLGIANGTSSGVVNCKVTYRFSPTDISKYSAQVGDRSYNGKASEPAVNLYYKYKSGVLASPYEYKILTFYKAVGPAKATIAGVYPFTGTRTVSYGIYPTKTSIKSISKAKKGFTVKWKKHTTQTTGYQIRYSLKKNMSKSKKVTVNGKTKTSKKISKLKSKKKYYVQVRTFKRIGNTRYCSGWSATKTVKTK